MAQARLGRVGISPLGRGRAGWSFSTWRRSWRSRSGGGSAGPRLVRRRWPTAGLMPPLLAGLVRLPARRANAPPRRRGSSPSIAADEHEAAVLELVRANVAAVLGDSSAARSIPSAPSPTSASSIRSPRWKCATGSAPKPGSAWRRPRSSTSRARRSPPGTCSPSPPPTRPPRKTARGCDRGDAGPVGGEPCRGRSRHTLRKGAERACVRSWRASPRLNSPGGGSHGEGSGNAVQRGDVRVDRRGDSVGLRPRSWIREMGKLSWRTRPSSANTWSE